MSIDIVNDIAPRRQYVAAAAQEDFDYPFPIFEDADLVVDVDGVTMALNTDYTVTGEGEDTGGTVSFVTPLVGGETVTIHRDIAIARDTDFQQNGPFRAAAINNEFDKTFLIMQELESKIGRALRLPITAEATDTQIEMAPLDNWKGRYVTISASGVPEPAVLSAETMTQSTIGALLHPRTPAESTAGVTPTNYARLPPSAARYGFDTAASGATNRAAVVACLAANGEAYLPAGTYPWAGAVLTLAAGQKVYGDSDVLQNPTTILQRSSGDYLGYFDTDSTTSAFTGIYIANIKATGGSSATWADVQGKWLVESHLPFTRIKNLHIEDGANFWGNGVRLHNDDSSTNGGSMGAWGSDIEGLRFVGTTSTPADNSAIGLDMKINGGWVTVRRSSMQRFNTGAWVRSGENISFDDVDIEQIRAGGSADRDNAALIIGEANSSSRVKGFSFKGYIEGVGRAILAQNTDGMKVFGSYMNAVRSFSPSGGADGFIYLNKTCHGVVIEGNSVESQYNLPAVIYSETPYVTSGNKLFINSTNSSYVPQPYYGGGIFEGTRPSSTGDTTIYLTDSATSAAISGVAASGSLVEITKSSHGLSTGRFVWVEGITGTVGDVVNGRLWRITSTGANTFTLDGSLHSGSYTSGGNYWLPTVKTGDESGSFTATLTGCTTSPTASVTWSRAGRVVSMVIPSLTATSNTTACTLTGLPDELMPLVVKRVVCRAVDNGATAFSIATIDPSTPGTIALGYGATAGAFTGSGTKGSSVTEITYSLD